MVISDTNSGPTMAISVSISESTTLFTTKFSWNENLITTKKLLKKLETTGNGATTNNNLLDSMRSSSPTRRNSNAQDQNSWILGHPSALSMFEEIMVASKGKKIVVFLDYDGTLSPIVADPDRAFMADEMREAVKSVANYFPTAIVSGRSQDKVYDFVRLPELYYAGSHGMDIKGPSELELQKENQTVLCQPARKFLPIIEEVHKILLEKINKIHGAKVENNKFCLSVHFRCVDEKRWGELADLVKSVIIDYQELKLTQGRKVLEIRPTIKWDKGNALEFLLESLGYARSNDVFPVYIGDDRTDEDAFRVLCKRGQGIGIIVSKAPKETIASYSLQDPSEVMHFLKRLVEWKLSQLSTLNVF